MDARQHKETLKEEDQKHPRPDVLAHYVAKVQRRSISDKLELVSCFNQYRLANQVFRRNKKKSITNLCVCVCVLSRGSSSGSKFNN